MVKSLGGSPDAKSLIVAWAKASVLLDASSVVLAFYRRLHGALLRFHLLATCAALQPYRQRLLQYSAGSVAATWLHTSLVLHAVRGVHAAHRALVCRRSARRPRRRTRGDESCGCRVRHRRRAIARQHSLEQHKSGNLSEPFKRNVAPGKLFTPEQSRELLSNVIENATINDSGNLLAFDGETISP